MDYRVEEIESERAEVDFLDLPEKIYRGDANWVAPIKAEVRRVLDSDKNPYFSEACLRRFICYRSAEPVARAAVVIDKRYWLRWGTKAATFGYFESEDDPEAADVLFGAVERYCREWGAEVLEGPFNPNHYSEVGMLIGPFDSPPRFFEPYNPAYYPKLLEDLGYRVQKRLHTRSNRWMSTERTVGVSNPGLTSPGGGFTIRPFDLRRMSGDLERMRQVFNDAFLENWHFLPLSKEEYRFTSKYLFFVTQPRLVLIVERGREPVGVLSCALNINTVLQPYRGEIRTWQYPELLWKRRSIQEIIVYAAGIKRQYRGTDVREHMRNAMFDITRRYPLVATTWMTDDNVPPLRETSRWGLRPDRWFAIYEKAL